jgi:hypothetical protein
MDSPYQELSKEGIFLSTDDADTDTVPEEIIVDYSGILSEDAIDEMMEDLDV